MKKNTMRNVFWGVMLMLDIILNLWLLINPEKFGKWCRKLTDGMYPELDKQIKDTFAD